MVRVITRFIENIAFDLRACGGLLTCALAATLMCANGAQGASLPRGFVYLRDIAPTIVQDIRYYGRHNFVGRKVDGYRAPECVLTRRAAIALKRVQDRLVARNLSLKVYDCYRPMRAVRHFVRWARRLDDTLTKREFYPTLRKSNLFRLGYISKRSSHASGSTVDLTIVAQPVREQAQFRIGQRLQPCYLPASQRFADNSLDMGTGFDCFHVKSHTFSSAIGQVARRNRRLLISEMARAGFRNYKREWWHFTLNGEPYRGRYFDFPIRPRAVPASARPETDRPAPRPERNTYRPNGSAIKSFD